MAHFVGIKSSIAGWVAGTAITQGNMWQIDSDLAKAVNGDDGGAWSPSAAIQIGGAYGLSMSAPLVVTNAVLTLSGTASISAASAAYTLGAGTFSGVAQFNSGFTVADGDVSFGGQSNTEVLGAWQFTYGFTSLGDTVIGAASGTHTIVIRATETHHGTEYHNGQEEHAGAVYLNGDTIIAAGHDVTGFEVITASGAVRAWDSANALVLALSSGGGAITMSAPGGHSGVRKFIKCAANAAYSAQVIDGYSGLSMYTLAAGDSCWIISDGTRWV